MNNALFNVMTGKCYKNINKDANYLSNTIIR